MDKFQQADYNWLECMKRIGRKEMVCFEQDNVGYSNQIVWYTSRRGIMVWVYSTLKTAGLIMAIEGLEVDVKKQMWEFVNEICAGREVDKKSKIEIAKTFYVIEYFLNENK